MPLTSTAAGVSLSRNPLAPAGLLAITLKVVSVVPVIAIRRGEVDPSLHAALQEMADAACVVSLPALGISVGAAAAVVLRTGVLPAWLGWFSALTALLLIANGFAVGGDQGPAFLLWTLITGIVLLRRAVVATRPSVARPGRVVTS